MEMALGGHARSEIENMVVAAAGPLLGDHLQEPAIEPRPGGIRGQHLEDLLGGGPVGLEVVMAAKNIVVDPAGAWFGGVNVHVASHIAV